MFLLGAISLLVSAGYNSSILAFIGLGLVFWGGVLLYIRPEEYTKKVLLEAVSSPSLGALYQLIRDLGYRGDRTYLPPKYFADAETTKVYVSKYKRRGIPTPELAQLYDDRPMAKNPLGMLITPPGIQLSRLLEKSLGKSFTKTGLKALQQDLPRLFIEKLEIAEDLELQEENDMASMREGRFASPTGTKRPRSLRKGTVIYAKMTKPIYQTVFKEAEGPSQITSFIGCPLCSAIAIAMAKSTGKPVRITDIKSFEDGNTLEVSYKILEG
jgi:hypothetical protein